MNRRSFLKSLGLGTLAMIDYNEVFGKNTTSKYDFLKIYDEEIDSYLRYFEKRHGISPGKNLIKGMIFTESGSLTHRNTAFAYDPMQVLDVRETLGILQRDEENTSLIGDFSCLDNTFVTRNKKGRPIYSPSSTNITPEQSIFAGIGWLYHKAVKEYGSRITGERKEYQIKKGDVLERVARNLGTTVNEILSANPGTNPNRLKIGQIVAYHPAKRCVASWKSWTEAVERYNASEKSREYVEKVFNVKKELDNNQ